MPTTYIDLCLSTQCYAFDPVLFALGSFFLVCACVGMGMTFKLFR